MLYSVVNYYTRDLTSVMGGRSAKKIAGAHASESVILVTVFLVSTACAQYCFKSAQR